MKIICQLTCIVSCSLFSAVAFTQNNPPDYLKNEISLTYGVLSVPELAASLESLFLSAIPGQELNEIRGAGSLVISYNHYLKEKISVGITGVYERITALYKNPADEYDWTALTLMANGKYSYISTVSFSLYSSLAAGYTQLSSHAEQGNSDNGVFSFQVNAIGVRFGTRLGVLTELGFGYEGIVKAGLSFRF